MRETLFGRGLWRLAAIAAGLMLLSGLTWRPGVLALPAAALQTLLTPAERVVAAAMRAAAGAVAGVGDLWRLREENARLRAELAQLQAQQAQDAELRAENRQLLSLLQLREADAAAGYGTGIAARVVARNPDAWLDSVTVDKGSLAGVRAGMVAVTPQGLVGRVGPAVAPNAAQVMLLTHPDFGVGVLVQRSRDAGVAQGRLGTGLLTVTFFSVTADVRPGDLLVTSGITTPGAGGGFPKGLPVGTVRAVTTGGFGLVRQAEAIPTVALDGLEQVLLLPAAGPGAGGG